MMDDQSHFVTRDRGTLTTLPRLTHKQKVRALLSDHQWHSHREGYALGVMLHSRISDLRADGHVIEQRRVKDHYEYRLLPALDAGVAHHGGHDSPHLSAPPRTVATPASSAAATAEVSAGLSAQNADDPDRPLVSHQLDLWTAA